MESLLDFNRLETSKYDFICIFSAGIYMQLKSLFLKIQRQIVDSMGLWAEIYSLF
jgi:hypothetical protein